MFLDSLPKWEQGSHKGKINWKESVGCKVKFVYDNIESYVNIIDFKDRRVSVKYKDNIQSMAIGQFGRCEIGFILGAISHEHKYPIGTIIDNINYGIMEITEQIRIGKRQEKGYKYICKICGNEDIIIESNLIQGSGCNVCCPATKKVLKGYNDLWTTHPFISKFLKNQNEGYIISSGSNKKTNWKCPECGVERRATPNDITSDGYSCTSCGDGISFPEKLMSNLLKQACVIFERERTFDWSHGKRYDFYIKSLNCIIETHGLQHYKDNMNWTNRFRDFEEEKENDILKKQLALENNIDYYVIDCRESNMEYIRNNILNNRLNGLLDLNKINWYECAEFALSNLVKQVCDTWNLNTKNIELLKETFKVTRSCLRNYLKQGAKLGWCDYDPKLNNLNPNSQKVICLNTKDVYHSIWEASKHYNCSETSINRFCNGISSFSGDILDGEYLQWQFYDEYLLDPKTLISKENIDILKCKKMHKMSVICLTTGEVFESIKDASKWCGLKTSASICSCCKGKLKSAGKHPSNGETLNWSYLNTKIA